MTFNQKEFGFHGRIGRVTYFGFNVMNTVAGALVVTVAVANMVRHNDQSSVMLSLALMAVTLIALMWSGLALLIKRLHDIGLAGTHAIWIYLLGISSGAIAAHSAMLGATLMLANLGVALWLLFQRGQDSANRYGDIPA
jgi:uncharacterized membrane protein YhaH (DUF805 family)